MSGNQAMMMKMMVRQYDIYWMIQDITSAWHLQPARHSPDYADVEMMMMMMVINMAMPMEMVMDHHHLYRQMAGVSIISKLILEV